MALLITELLQLTSSSYESTYWYVLLPRLVGASGLLKALLPSSGRRVLVASGAELLHLNYCQLLSDNIP